MAWFYYSGTTIRSIVAAPGVSVAARPHSKVQIHDTTSSEVQAMISRGLLRPTGGPKDARAVVPVKAEPPVVLPSDLALSVAEKGVTSSPMKPPRRTVGVAELTDGESQIASTVKRALGDDDQPTTAEPLPDESAAPNGANGRDEREKRRRRR